MVWFFVFIVVRISFWGEEQNTQHYKNEDMKFYDWSVKTKLVLGTTILFVLSFAGISTFNYWHSSTALEEKITHSQLPLFAKNIRYEIESYLSKGVLPVEVVAGNTFIQEQLKSEEIDTIRVRKYLKSISNKYNTWVGFVSSKHKMFVMNQGSTRYINEKSDMWYYAFYKSEETTQFNVDSDMATGLVRLWTNHKIYDSEGNFLGVCFSSIDAATMKEFILSRKFENEGSIMVAEQEGGIIFHEDTSYVDINQEHREGHTLQTISRYTDIADKILVQKDTYFTVSGINSKLYFSTYIPEFKWYTVIELQRKSLLASVKEMLIYNLVIALVITALVIVLNVLVIDYMIVKPLKMIIQVANEFANGYLLHSLEFFTKDEIGILGNRLNRMKKKLRNIVGNIQKTSSIIVDASEELKINANNLSETSHQQAVNVEQVSSSMEEMLSNIHQNASSAEQTDTIAQDVKKDMVRVNGSVENTLNAMKDIAEKIQKVAEIASRTDMLAINAAIEASRAGAAGKGFSTVASEVRNLAESSRKTTAEIQELSNHSVGLAEESMALINEVLPKIKETSVLVQSISTANKEQKAGAETVNETILELSDIAQQNASAAEELAANAELFTEQATELTKNTSFFRLTKDENEEHMQQVRTEIEKLQNQLLELQAESNDNHSGATSSHNNTFTTHGKRIDMSSNWDDDDDRTNS